MWERKTPIKQEETSSKGEGKETEKWAHWETRTRTCYITVCVIWTDISSPGNKSHCSSVILITPLVVNSSYGCIKKDTTKTHSHIFTVTSKRYAENTAQTALLLLNRLDQYNRFIDWSSRFMECMSPSYKPSVCAPCDTPSPLLTIIVNVHVVTNDSI